MVTPEQDHVDQMIATWRAHHPELDVAPLAVAGRILRLARRLQLAIDAALAPTGVSFGDFDVINTIRRLHTERGVQPSELARACLITTGAMTARLDRLEQRELITRTADGADRRSVRIALTPAGHRLAEDTVRQVLAADESVLAPLDDTDRDRLAGLLRTLLIDGDQPAAPRHARSS